MISGRAPLPGLFDSRSTFACLPPREFTPAQPPAALQQQEARRSAHPHREPKRHPSTPRFPAHVRSLQEPPRHALDTPWQQSAIIQNRNLLRWQIERTGRLEGRSGTLTGRTGIFNLFRGGGTPPTRRRHPAERRSRIAAGSCPELGRRGRRSLYRYSSFKRLCPQKAVETGHPPSPQTKLPLRSNRQFHPRNRCRFCESSDRCGQFGEF